MSSMAYRYGGFLDNLDLNRRHWIIFSVCAAGFLFDAADFQIMALVAPAIAREWSLDSRALGFILSSTGVGMLIGSYLFGLIADRIGRRSGFQITIAIVAVFSGLCGLAQDPTQLAILRFLTGVGIGGFVPIDTAIISEYMPASKRGRLMALWALFFPVGGLVAAGAAQFIFPAFGWRGMFIAGVAPAIMVFLVRILIPETPRFLLDRGRLKEALRSIAWVANGRALPEAEEVNAAAPNAQINRMTVGELFSPTYRTRTTMLWLVWFGWSFSYFGVLLWLPSLLVQYRGVPGPKVFTFIMGFLAAGIVGRILVSFVIDRWGRKKTIAFLGVAAAISLFIFGNSGTYEQLILSGYIYAMFHDGGLSAIAPYTPELYPTRARATGVGWANGAGRIASIVAPIAVGYVVHLGLEFVFGLLACGFVLATVSVLVLGTEARGMILEEASLEAKAESP
jgi:putative MFS transporter